MAADLALPGARPSLRELSAFLQLSEQQAQAIGRLRLALAADLQQLARQAPAPAGGPPDTEPSATCQRALARVAQHRQQALAGLSETQRQQLAQLEQALALMPLVEAAQSAGLVADRLWLPPVGMPAGSVEVEQAWQRVSAPALPGCQDTRVHRELGLPDGLGARKPRP